MTWLVGAAQPATSPSSACASSGPWSFLLCWMLFSLRVIKIVVVTFQRSGTSSSSLSRPGALRICAELCSASPCSAPRCLLLPSHSNTAPCSASACMRTWNPISALRRFRILLDYSFFLLLLFFFPGRNYQYHHASTLKKWRLFVRTHKAPGSGRLTTKIDCRPNLLILIKIFSSTENTWNAPKTWKRSGIRDSIIEKRIFLEKTALRLIPWSLHSQNNKELKGDLNI